MARFICIESDENGLFIFRDDRDDMLNDFKEVTWEELGQECCVANAGERVKLRIRDDFAEVQAHLVEALDLLDHAYCIEGVFGSAQEKRVKALLEGSLFEG